MMMLMLMMKMMMVIAYDVDDMLYWCDTAVFQWVGGRIVVWRCCWETSEAEEHDVVNKQQEAQEMNLTDCLPPRPRPCLLCWDWCSSEIGRVRSLSHNLSCTRILSTRGITMKQSPISLPNYNPPHPHPPPPPPLLWMHWDVAPQFILYYEHTLGLLFLPSTKLSLLVPTQPSLGHWQPPLPASCEWRRGWMDEVWGRLVLWLACASTGTWNAIRKCL